MMDRESERTNFAAALDREASPVGWRVAVAEVAVILAVFAAAGAWPVPDVNETAYLTKARHDADPAWCRGDFFLETPDAHGVFYLLAGPLAAALTLEQAAWIGRWLGWLTLACGFRWATLPLLSGGPSRVIAAAIFSLALRHTTAAGEWVIGGCEAKVFAWGLVLVAIGEIGRGRFGRAWPALGAATALHPIVGGWGMVALVLSMGRDVCMRIAGARDAAGATTVSGRSWLPVNTILISAGLLLAAAGVVPALGLSAGADAATRAAAAKIHVVERLAHHLLIRSFAPGMVSRHLLAVMVWWLLRRCTDAGAVDDAAAGRRAARVRVDRFIVASVGIWLAGCAISLLEPWAAEAAYGLLRFYWFRLADVLVPFGLATAAAAAIESDSVARRLVPVSPVVTRAIVSIMLCIDLADESRHWPLPGRTALVARSDTKVDAAAWRDICDWVVAHAPADACFLTPRGAASFTWLTGRREVVAWKNSPQDAGSLVEWRRRFADCFSRDGSFANMERSTAALGADRVRLVAGRYGATHAIIPVDVPGGDALPFERLHANRGFVVYSLAGSANQVPDPVTRDQP